MNEIQSFYGSFYQQPLLLALPSLVWLAVLLTRLGPKDWTWKYCTLFAALSIVDAFLTANDVLGLGPLPASLASIVPTFFVILGDFRVLTWIFRDGLKKKWPIILGLSLVVPILSIVLRSFLPALWIENPRSLYLLYEVLFVVVFGTVSLTLGRPNGGLNRYTCYVLTYYSLWALADIWLLATDSSATAAWVMRICANLLYYVGWTPWVYFNFRRETR